MLISDWHVSRARLRPRPFSRAEQAHTPRRNTEVTALLKWYNVSLENNGVYYMHSVYISFDLNNVVKLNIISRFVKHFETDPLTGL